MLFVVGFGVGRVEGGFEKARAGEKRLGLEVEFNFGDSEVVEVVVEVDVDLVVSTPMFWHVLASRSRGFCPGKSFYNKSRRDVRDVNECAHRHINQGSKGSKRRLLSPPPRQHACSP